MPLLFFRDIAAFAVHSLGTHLGPILLIWLAVMAIWALTHWSKAKRTIQGARAIGRGIVRVYRDRPAKRREALLKAQQLVAAGDYEQACQIALPLFWWPPFISFDYDSYEKQWVPWRQDMVPLVTCLRESAAGLRSDRPEITDELEKYIGHLQQILDVVAAEEARMKALNAEQKDWRALLLPTIQQRSVVRDLLNRTNKAGDR